MQKITRFINGFTDLTGRLIAWLTLALVILTTAVVILRYFLGSGSIALQESVTYVHATLFMLAIAYTLKQGGHVRVDVFYRNFSPRKQALVDVVGGVIFLLPVSVFILLMSWDYVLNSWAIRETSQEASGLPFVYLLKSLMLVLPVTLVLQGIAEIINNLLFCLGRGGVHTAEKLESL